MICVCTNQYSYFPLLNIQFLRCQEVGDDVETGGQNAITNDCDQEKDIYGIDTFQDEEKGNHQQGKYNRQALRQSKIDADTEGNPMGLCELSDHNGNIHAQDRERGTAQHHQAEKD